MLNTMQGPRLTIAERVATRNMKAISPPELPPHFALFLDIYIWGAMDADTLTRAYVRDTLLAHVNAAFASDRLTLGQAVKAQDRIRAALPC